MATRSACSRVSRARSEAMSGITIPSLPPGRRRSTRVSRPPRHGPGPTTLHPWASYALRSSTRMNLNSHAVATTDSLRLLPREVLPPLDDDVAVGRTKLHEETFAPGLLRADERGPAAPEQIQDVLAGLRG